MAVLIILLAIFYGVITFIIGFLRLGDYLNHKEIPQLYGGSYKESARKFIRTPLWPLDLLKSLGQVFVDAGKL